MRTVLALILVLFTASTGVASARPAAAEATDTERTLSPYFFVDGAKPGVEAFPLKSTTVTANVSGVIADVTVKQVYENHGNTPINAKYVFPGSTRAAVHGLRIRIGDKAVVAKIKEREKAAKEFEEAKAAGKSAALLEQQRPNVFTMAVANIMPGDHVEVELTYNELLTPEEGVYQFVYPAVVGPRYSNTPESTAPADSQWVKSPYLQEGADSPATLSIQVKLSTGLPVAEMKSPSHQPKIDWENPALAHVSLVNDAGNRDFILDYKLSGKQLQSGLIVYEDPVTHENFFLVNVQPPERVGQSEIPSREYIFVLDVSGSMHGFPLNTAKRVIGNLVNNLKPTDTFNVVLFSGASRVLAPQSVMATKENVTKILQEVERQGGGGGTELESALKTATALPRGGASRTIVVVTDGYIAEERGALDLIRKNLDNTNFFALGIGSSVNRFLIEGIARAGQGEPFVVTDAQEADAAGERFRRYIQTPVLTGVRVTYSGFDTYDVEPAAQPDVFAERPVVVFGKWRGPKRGQIEVFGRTATGTFAQTFDVSQSATRDEHGALPQLWARTRIARLSDFNGDSDEEAVREVTTLGLTYSLLTRHTSFIAVLEEIRNTKGSAENVDQPLPLPAGVSALAVSYASGAEPEFWMLLVGAAGLMLALSIYSRLQ